MFNYNILKFKVESDALHFVIYKIVYSSITLVFVFNIYLIINFERGDISTKMMEIRRERLLIFNHVTNHKRKL